MRVTHRRQRRRSHPARSRFAEGLRKSDRISWIYLPIRSGQTKRHPAIACIQGNLLLDHFQNFPGRADDAGGVLLQGFVRNQAIETWYCICAPEHPA